MGDLVSDGTEFACPFCTSKLKLKVPSSPATGDGKKLANMANCFFPPPGGNCIVIPSAPVPCTPAAVPIDPGQSPVKIQNMPALGAGCKFQCAKGGLLTVSSSGQSKAKHEEASSGQVAAAAAAVVGPTVNLAYTDTDESETNEKQKKKNPKKEQREKSRAKSIERGGAQRKGAPGKNYEQNKMANGAKQEIQRKIGRKLTDDEHEIFHDAVTGQDYTYQELVDVGLELFK